MKYSKRIKESVLRKVLPPENRRVPEVAREMGISEQTIYNWKKLAENGSMTLDVEQTSPVSLSSAEKLALLLEGSKKDETDMGAWLREKGLHSEHLNLWGQELRDTLKEKDAIFVRTSLIPSGYFSMNRQIVLWSIVLFAEKYITF